MSLNASNSPASLTERQPQLRQSVGTVVQFASLVIGLLAQVALSIPSHADQNEPQLRSQQTPALNIPVTAEVRNLGERNAAWILRWSTPIGPAEVFRNSPRRDDSPPRVAVADQLTGTSQRALRASQTQLHMLSIDTHDDRRSQTFARESQEAIPSSRLDLVRCECIAGGAQPAGEAQLVAQVWSLGATPHMSFQLAENACRDRVRHSRSLWSLELTWIALHHCESTELHSNTNPMAPTNSSSPVNLWIGWTQDFINTRDVPSSQLALEWISAWQRTLNDIRVTSTSRSSNSARRRPVTSLQIHLGPLHPLRARQDHSHGPSTLPTTNTAQVNEVFLLNFIRQLSSHSLPGLREQAQRLRATPPVELALSQEPLNWASFTYAKIQDTHRTKSVDVQQRASAVSLAVREACARQITGLNTGSMPWTELARLSEVDATWRDMLCSITQNASRDLDQVAHCRDLESLLASHGRHLCGVVIRSRD